MKKKIALLLLSVMVVGTMAGCGKKDATTDNASNATEEGTEGSDNTDSVEGDSASSDSASNDTVSGNTVADSGETLADLDTSLYVTLGEYKGITVDVEKLTVDDEKVEEYIQDYLIPGYAEYVEFTAEDTVENGDFVTYACVGKIDGEVFDGGSSVEGADWTVTIGSGQMIPGFEEGMVGMKVGETRDVVTTFPENYKADLAGKEAVFTITVNKAEKMITADSLTAEVLAYYEYADEQECRDDVKAALIAEYETQYLEAYESAVLQKVVEGCTFTEELPQFLVDMFVADQNDYYVYYATLFGMDLTSFVESYLQVTMEDYNSQIQEISKEYARQYLMYEAIADAEDINLTKEEIDVYGEETVVEYGYENLDALYADFGYDEYRDFVTINEVIALIMEYASNSSATVAE